MKKVGILSCYKHHNYGSMLQAYATEKAVERLDAEAITIAYDKLSHYMTQSRLRYYFHKINNRDILFRKIRFVISRIIEKKYRNIVKERKIRDSLFDSFWKTYFNLSEMNNTRKDLTTFSSTCDVILVGSDQLWHPINIEYDFFTLSFVPCDIKKISYATSIGATVIPEYQKKTYINFLDSFSLISVRESSAVQTLKKLGVKKNIEVVLDPTLLFSGEEWMCIQKTEPVINNKYILCYFLGTNEEHRTFAKAIKRITGYKIVALQNLDEFIERDLGYADQALYNIGPAEFINLIRNAEYVCTDSFHGSCFSILYHKKFFTFERHKIKDSQSTNSRIYSLFDSLGIMNRRINNVLSDDKINKLLNDEINYASIDEKIKIMRRNSFGFLKKAIYGG